LWGRWINPGLSGQPRGTHVRTGAIPDADADGDPDTSDCDDTNPAIYTGAAEVPDNGLDDDCDGVALVTCWADVDGDGSGAGPSSLVDAFLCVPPDEATTDGDCEPYDPAVHPGALELVGDGIDQDCSGADSVLCYPDLDGDGYGSGNATADVDGFCDAATNQSAVPGDCDDGNPALHPTATDLPDNGLDEDCTGAGLVTCYADADADYWGGPSTLDPDGSCTDDSGQWGVGGDCLDNDPMAHPGATDVPGNGVDEDCSGADSVLCFTDADGDGWGTGAASLDTDGVCAVASGQSGTGGDCNDAQALIHPFAAELADNGLDEDCSGADTVSCFQDVDGDGWGGLVSADPDGSCTDDPGQAGTPGDCDDLDAQTHPGATEVLSDGLDQDCTGADTALCWVDADGDGYGGASEQQDPDGSCLDDAGQTATPGDCADGNAAWNPAALDPPGDGLDQDCSGEDALSCWTDGDSDGWGVPPLVTDPDGDCTDDPGQADQGGDCDDLSLQRFPGNPEVADDGIDQDCSGWDDLTCYADQDGDGWGSSFTLVSPDGSCTDDPGEAPLGGDCEDQDPTVFPGATDIAGDGVDQDCSGLDSAACWADGDGDGVGGAVAQGDADGSCLDDPGQSALSGDCDDTDPTRFPGAPETPGDGIDQDCTFTDAALCFVDADGDGVGALLTTIEGDGDCDDDLGASSLSTDCDDADPTRWPGAPEFSFDGIDQDCDGADLLACLTDQDGDGWAGPTAIASSDQDCDDPGEFWTAADCDDASPFVNPGETDAPGNGVDEDCSGSDSVWCYEDIDGDGLGNVPVLSPDADCDDPLEGSTFGDCDDGNPFIGAGEAEICNGLDDDCDPATDEAADGDGDGVSACEGDCDDQDPARGPLAVEVCDGLDNDCEPGTDEGEDPDGDGFNLCEGDCAPFDPATSPVTAELCDGQDQDCDGAPLADEVDDDGDGVRLCEGDCDDLLPEVHPGATELCDGLDDDCDGFPGPAEEDTDQDGLTACEGDCGPGDPLVSPTQSEGTLPPEELDADGDLWMPCTGDCDDGDAAAHPYAPEVAAGPDTNCDGLVGDADEDGDGSSVSEGDCDDADPEVHPGAAERCNGADDDCDGIFLAGERMDQDGDGSVDCLDCNALDPTIHPGATELCDGIDGDCDGYGIVPGEVDFDGDGAIPCMGDCDEGNPLVRQGIPEDCADGLDNDCDGTVDLNTDADQDGVGACDGDCQDTDSDVYPFAVEHCDGQDEDCDALVDEGFDADGDGHTTCGGDCDDSLPTVWPGAPAVCDDGLDNDCFPSTHEDVDLDGDGYVACGDPADCWEGNVRVSPLGLEVCNGLDDDCDGEIDGGIDTDGDGFSPCSFDCLEGDAQVNPRSPEVCGDGLDQDCDLLVDEDCEGDDDSAMADDDDSAGTPGVEDCGACAAAGGGAWGWAGLIVVLGLVLRRGASATRPAATRRG
jgi:hypothetical protein